MTARGLGRQAVGLASAHAVPRRRLLAAGLAAAPVLHSLNLRAEAQTRLPRIGYLNLRSGPIAQDAAFLDGLRELGYVDGRNIRIDYRWAAGNAERLEALAGELVRLDVDVIVTASVLAIQAAMRATSRIPIVMAAAADPVGSGLVASLAKPGGNVTGISLLSTDLAAKRVALLRELLPEVKRVAVLVQRTVPLAAPVALFIAASQQAAQQLGLQLLVFDAATADELPLAFAAMRRERAQALVVQVNPLSNDRSAQITELAAQHRLPAMYDIRIFVDAGGLLSYGPNIADGYRRAAAFVDKILRGAKPAEMPVEQPTTFQLVINLKTAKALGLAVPQALLLRADDVIQ
jgi:putative ABC transport system substrate-binding protein